MIKVVIVDDEILIRVGIKSSLNWEDHGFQIAGQAENGIKALEVIEATQPGIVLTDIKMPKMDGLQLISEIKKRWPNIRIVVLSCLNEVDYVKNAMKLGAEDYILKLTLEPDSLLQVMLKVKQTIEEYQSDIGPGSNENMSSQYVLKEDIYKKMVEGSIGNEDFARKISSYGMDLQSTKLIALCCGIDDYENAPKRSKMDDRYLFKFSFINILQEILTGCYDSDAAEIGNGEYIIILKWHNDDESMFSKDVIQSCLRRINNSIKKYLNVTLSFGIYRCPVEYIGLKDAYSKARTAMRYRFYKGRESIVFFEDIVEFTNKLVYLDIANEQKLNRKLEEFDESGIRMFIDGFFDDISISGTIEPNSIRKVSAEVCESISRFVKMLEISDDSLYSFYNVHPLDFLLTAETLDDIKEWFGEFVKELYGNILYRQYEAKRPEIKKLQKYIAENISENITLDKASRISNISRCYLSSIFKKETGDTFVDYVNKAKMERARLMIQQGSRINEAARGVGIDDDSYFSKLFKKYMGISPSKFMKTVK